MRIKNNLLKKGYICEIFENSSECIDNILSEINADKSVGIGGSVTLDTLDIYSKLIDKGVPCHWHWKNQNWSEEMKAARTCDYYISSVNAITEDGEIHIVDRIGNRISAISFGHEKVFFIIGRNKIVLNKEEALNRITGVATKLNARRIIRDSLEGKREKDFNTESETQNLELILKSAPPMQETYVYIINEDLGY